MRRSCHLALIPHHSKMLPIEINLVINGVIIPYYMLEHFVHQLLAQHRVNTIALARSSNTRMHG